MSAEKTVSHRKRVSSFRSLSFSFSQKAFVVATVKEDLVTKSEREICKSQTVSDQEFMQNSGSILPRVVSRNQPRGIQRIVYPNVWSTGAVLPIRAGTSSSSFSSRVKSTLSGVYLQRTKAFQKSRYGKKTNIFYFIKYFETRSIDNDAERRHQKSFRLSREKRRKRRSTIRENVEQAERATGSDGIEEIKNCRYQMREKSDAFLPKRLQLLHSSPRVYESKRVWKEKRTRVFRVPGT